MYKKLLFLLPCLLAFTLLTASKLPSAKIRRAVSEAIRAGDGKALSDVLAKYGLHFNSVIMPGGYTLLHDAAIEGTPELVSYLIANDAQVNVTNDYGATPLDEATVFEKKEIATLLEQAGATHGEVLYVKAVPTGVKADPNNIDVPASLSTRISQIIHEGPQRYEGSAISYEGVFLVSHR